MTNNEKKKLIDYLLDRGYTMLECLRDVKLYSFKERIGQSHKGHDIYMDERITFYTVDSGHYQCVMQIKIYELDYSTLYNLIDIQKKIESVESFIEFKKGIPLLSKFCNDHLFKSCEDGKEIRTELL